MRYERTMLLLSGNRRCWRRSARVGQWHAHLSAWEIGITISHQSGLSAIDMSRPGQAVAILRRLQALPPCPVSDADLIRIMDTHTTSRYPHLAAWLATVKRAIGTGPAPGADTAYP